MNPVEELEESASLRLGRYWDMIVRRRWWLIGSAASCWAVALTLSMLLPGRYKSESMVLIEQQKVPAQYVTPNVTMDLHERLESLKEQILSRTRLAQLMDDFHLYGKQPQQNVTADMIQRMRKDIEIELAKPSGGGGISAFKIAYSSSSPVVAQEVVARLTSFFIGEDLRSEQELSEDTTSFLQSQLDQARKDLEQQEAILGQFRSKYLGELPEQLSSNVQILSGLQNRLQLATEGLHQAEQQRLYLQSMAGQMRVSSESSGKSGAQSEMDVPPDEQIARMQAELEHLSAQYTPRHPDVIRLKEQITAAEKRWRKAAQGAKGDAGAGTSSAEFAGISYSPAGQLASQIKANELEITNRKSEIKGLEREIGQYQGRLNMAPLLEQQLAGITRNHDQSRANYESLLAKKLQSEMATDLSRRRQGGQFRTIDPASFPQQPYWPNPLLFSMAGLSLGSVLGFGAILLIETVDPRIYREDSLRGWAAVPVMATIPPLPTTAEQHAQRWQRRAELVMASAMILLIPVITLIAHWKR